MKGESPTKSKPESEDYQNNNMIASDDNNMVSASSLRLLIPSKTAGIIIGKGGDNIRNLRKEYSIKITIPDSTSFERILQLEGDMKTILEVLEKILQKTLTQDTTQLDVRLLVHSSQAGCVIGRSGAKIRELRENSGLKTLKVYQMLCPNSTDRVIQLVGDLDKVIGCIQAINELLAESPARGNRYPFDTRNSNDSLAVEYGGWGNPAALAGGGGGGPGGGMVSNRGAAFAGASYGFVNGAGGGGARGGMFNDMRQATGGDATAAAMMAAGMMRGAPPPRMSVAMTSTTQVSVSDKMIGAIMGRAGTRINQVRQESGADIKISNQEPGCEDRIITITGTPDQIQNAQFLLQVCVRKYGEAHM